jgi:hypothetical protein
MRLKGAGAVVVANIDVDRLTLPDSVSANAPPTLDFVRLGSLTGDDELLALEIRTRNDSAQAGSQFILKCSNSLHTRIRISRTTAAVLRQTLGTPQEYLVPAFPATTPLKLHLRVRAIPGSPFAHTSRKELVYRPDDEETMFELELLSRAPDGTETTHDRGRFTIAPFILVDRSAPCTRVYICDLPENLASVKEVAKITKDIGVDLVKVPADIGNGDTWLQDQYQHAVMQGPRGLRQLILHLPRMRRNMLPNSTGPNLGLFVDAHFASKNIGLFADLYRRVLPVRTVKSGVLRIGFRDSYPLSNDMRRLATAVDYLNEAGKEADPTWSPLRATGWMDALIKAPKALARLKRRTEAAKAKSDDRKLLAQLDRRQKTADLLVTHVQNLFPLDEARERVQITVGGKPVQLDRRTVDDLYFRVQQMHSSANYGGNIESTPPVKHAPLGKILIGNRLDVNIGDFMDPDLLRVLAKQKKQPLVEIDTTWLHVGHVDEMVAIVPRSGKNTGFSLLMASSKAAMLLLRKAEARHFNGLPEGETKERTEPIRSRRLMDKGSSPVTRLLRGKTWLHTFPPTKKNELPDIFEPPRTFRKLVFLMNKGVHEFWRGAQQHFDVGYVPGPGPERRYRADITVSELLASELDEANKSTNDFIDEQFLSPARAKLVKELDGAPAFPLPVVFDRVASVSQWKERTFNYATSAFTPDAANLQFINGHVLIPRPYGPRMLIDDAIATVREAMKELKMGSVASRVGRRLIARHKMKRGIYWVHRRPDSVLYSGPNETGIILETYNGIETEEDIIEIFRNSFPGSSDTALKEKIIDPNSQHFDGKGNLKDGTLRFIITDDMVDLFELFILAVIEEVDAIPHFVDSWFYHVHLGGIHCGTNVLRLPTSSQNLPAFWDVPDVNFRPLTIDFEPEDMSTGSIRF